MSKEIKIGLLSVIVIAIMIWGYMFLKGRNILSDTTTLYAIYDDVTDLTISAPVVINGFKVGSITDIKPDPANVKQMIVTFVIEGDYGIPDNTEAVLYSKGVMGGKAISLEYDKPCDGNNCAKNKTQLKSKVMGFLDSMLGEGEIDKYSTGLSTSAQAIIANLGKEGEPGSLNETVRQIEIISKNLASLTATTQKVIESNAKNIDATMSNLAKVSQGVANNNKNIDNIIKNLEKLSGDLAKTNMDETFGKLDKTMDSATMSIDELKSTLNNLQGILHDVKKGDGTVSKLIYDQNLYKNLNATSRELSLLLQDLRLNPKRYAHFSLFGKKQKEYTSPEEDPAKTGGQ